MFLIDFIENGKILPKGPIRFIGSLLYIIYVIFLVSCSNTLNIRQNKNHPGSNFVIQTGHVKEITCVSFSPDDELIATGSRDGTIKLWETSTGRVAKTLFDPSRNGRWVTTGSNDLSGKGISRYYSVSDIVTSISFFLDGRFLLSSGIYGTLKLWDVTKGVLLKTVKLSQGQIKTIRYSDKKGRLLAIDSNNQIILINRKTFKIIKEISAFSGNGREIFFDAANDFALSENIAGLTALLNLDTEEIYKKFNFPGSPVTAMQISMKDRLVITGHQNGNINFWDIDSGKILNTINAHSTDILSIGLNPTESRLLATSSGKNVKIWNIQTMELIRELTNSERGISGIAFSNSGHFLISKNMDLTLTMWRLDSGNIVKIFNGTIGVANSAAFSPDGRYILTGLQDNMLCLWDFATGTQIKSFKLSSQAKLVKNFHRINVVGFSPDGGTVAGICSDGTKKLWDLASGKVVNDRIFTIRSNAMSYSPDGRYYLTGSISGAIVLYSANTGIKIRDIGKHSNTATAVAFSPDGRLAVTGSTDNTVNIWKLNPAYLIQTLKGHLGAITSVSFSPSGRFILSSSKDATTRIWDANSGREIVKLLSTLDGEWIATTPDGYYVNSIEGNSLLAWVFRGSNETYSYEQFETLFRKPEIIKLRLSGDFDAGVPPPVVRRPPDIKMLNHMALEKTTDKSYTVEIDASAIENLKTVRVFANGRPSVEIPAIAENKAMQIDVPVVAGLNRITVVAYDNMGYSSNPKYVDVIRKGEPDDSPTLHIVSIGVSKYRNLPSGWQLDYAHTDAKAIVDALRQQEGKAFKTINDVLLINENATAENVLDTIKKLESAGENDLIVIHMAGHGIRDNKDGVFYFLTYASEIEIPSKAGISWDNLIRHLKRIRSRTIIFLDACHSGSIVNETVVPNEQLAERLFEESRSGVMVFSASKGRQMSLESPNIGGGFGVFSYALVQCIGKHSREADSNSNGYVEFSEMVNWVTQYVDQLTAGEQTPWLTRKEMFGDIPLALVH